MRRSVYTQVNADDIDKAVQGLDQFTKNWCMNVAETEKQNDLIFRCKECEFETEDEGGMSMTEFLICVVIGWELITIEFLLKDIKEILKQMKGE